MEKNLLVYSSVQPQLNHKIESSWVKHSWFHSNENHEDITLENFPLYSIIMIRPSHIIIPNFFSLLFILKKLVIILPKPLIITARKAIILSN